MKNLNLKALGVFSSVVITTLMMGISSQSLFAETLRFSTPVPPNHIFTKVATKFSEDLKARTNGELDIKVFPFGELGTDPENAIMVGTGALNFAVIPAAFMANSEESLNAWFLPGLFNSVQDAGDATQLPAAKKMLAELDRQGMVGLGYVFAGMRLLISVDPVKSLSDITGKKISIFPVPIFNDWWLTFGAIPTAVPMPEIASALAINLIEVVDADLDLVAALKLYEQAPNLAMTSHMAFPGIVVVSKKWWESKSVEQRAVIRDVFAEAEAWGVKAQVMADEGNLNALKDAGVAITQIDKSSYVDNATDILNQYVKKSPTIAEFYEQVKAQK
ncbi:TRAP transporter substrate-binding protein [Marinomonas profundimaris]|uniref:C4-dicarboxylate ABC transporter n=1 Tax=Marinomonas profundimaris TaxID=1208321 RepID=W1RYL9_9GAMM|nr:TRAP transporter substrate-binding protein [Marinomonas profundimaris]ETI62281.1 C4-dicarboxylate ABC transporter [Marinomonas profundimaris]